MRIRSHVADVLNSPDPRPCGLCGQTMKLSKSHVPPQSAGNRGRVTRSADVIDEHGTRRAGRANEGGMWVRGLCEHCNNLAGCRYDRAYGHLHDQIARWSRPRIRQLLINPEDVPPVNCAPGLVSRAVMFGMFAINTRLRIIAPPLARQLLDNEPHVQLPNNLRLKLSLTIGKQALLSSGIYRARVINPGVGIHYFALADIVFPPLAWALVPVHDGPLLTDTWADVSGWPQYSDDRSAIDLRLLIRNLRHTVHPRLASNDDGWIEMLGESVALLGTLP